MKKESYKINNVQITNILNCPNCGKKKIQVVEGVFTCKICGFEFPYLQIDTNDVFMEIEE